MGSIEPRRAFACKASTPFDPTILEFLRGQAQLSLTTSSSTSSSARGKGRPVKRPRTFLSSTRPTTPQNGLHVPHVVLRWTTLNITFPTRPSPSHHVPSDLHLQKSDSMTVWVNREAEDRNYTLEVTSPASEELTIDLEFTTLEELPCHEFQLANLEDRKWAPRDGQGRIWSEKTLTLHRCEGEYQLTVSVCIKWEKTESPLHVGIWAPGRDMLNQCLTKYYPDIFDLKDMEDFDVSTPQAFYNSAHIPDKNDPMASRLQIPEIKTELYPFQKRSVLWLLGREGVQWTPSGLTALPNDDENALPPSFSKVIDDEGTPFFVSDEMKLATSDIDSFKQVSSKLRGGILAEEMGLGKTVEIISLITLNKFPDSGLPTSTEIPDGVVPVRATLLVVPQPLVDQWKSEIARHNPDLTVHQYFGFNAKPWSKNYKSPSEQAMCNFATHEIVITTYDVLKAEIHFSNPPPTRNMRNAPKLERPTSPLVKALWWRVCLDEAQMIESGVSAAAKVALKIPRINAWGISGTPIKRNIADLHGLLEFLKYEPYASNHNIWTHLINSPRNFTRCFNKIALRHSKHSVRDEIQLPPQKRFVITIPFNPIEQQNYQELMEAMLAECGDPGTDDWVPNYSKMRDWLKRLRKAALHPQIGQHIHKLGGNPIKTLLETVDAMIDELDQKIRSDNRLLLRLRLRRGQLLLNDARLKDAHGLFDSILSETRVLSDETREILDQEVRSSQTSSRRPSIDLESEIEQGDGEVSKLGIIKHRLSNLLEIQHMAVFFSATSCFQLKQVTVPDSEEYMQLSAQEEYRYAEAKAIRRELLQDITNKTTDLMEKIRDKASHRTLMNIPFVTPGIPAGITDVGTDLRKVCLLLDDQARHSIIWRDSAVKLLTRQLVDNEDGDTEVTGEEYENSTKLQEEVEVLVVAIKTMTSHRRDLLLGHRNYLTETNVKEARVLANQDQGPFPEKMREFLDICDRYRPSPDLSLAKVISDARSGVTELRKNKKTSAQYLSAFEAEFQRAQSLHTEQTKLLQSFEQHGKLLTATMNSRVEFYRQLQHISDTVRDLSDKGEEFPGEDVEDRLLIEQQVEKALAIVTRKKRYFETLRSQANSNERPICAICQEEFEKGVFTKCGHTYCKEDFRQWYHVNHKCPGCRTHLHREDFQDVICKASTLSGKADVHDSESDATRHKKSPIYADISKKTLEKINNIQLPNGHTFSAKIDTLAKHIIWLREKDPGAKSIVYSQWKEFLHLLSEAFKKYGIGFGSIEDRNGAEDFKNQVGKEVFLLHARAHSAGLNLVNANHVFLCEPLLNTALELQAIARVDRIGQKFPTSVWLYLIDGTVEQSIYDLSVTRRLEHLGQKDKGKGKSREASVDPEALERKIESANSLALQEHDATTSLEKGDNGEHIPDEELFHCLYGNRQNVQE